MTDPDVADLRVRIEDLETKAAALEARLLTLEHEEEALIEEEAKDRARWRRLEALIPWTLLVLSFILVAVFAFNLAAMYSLWARGIPASLAPAGWVLLGVAFLLLVSSIVLRNRQLKTNANGGT